MKIVETAINKDGQSVVFKQEEACSWDLEGHLITDLFFNHSFPEMDKTSDIINDRNFNLAPGEIRFFRSDIAPTMPIYDKLKQSEPNLTLDELFYHATTTVDYIMVLKGPLTMIVNDKKIELNTGDAVVQRGAAHAWHNYSNETATIMGVMIGVKPSPNFNRIDTVQPD